MQHPIKTYDYIETAIIDSYRRDMINGDAESRSRWVTYALGTVVTSVASPKGAVTVAKDAKVVANATKAAAKTVSKQATKAAKHFNTNIYSFLPYHQEFMAIPGGGSVPFNAVDGRNLLDGQLMKAERVNKYTKNSTVGGTGHTSNIKDIGKFTANDIPTAKSGHFNRFFNSLTSSELDKLWMDKKIRKKIERQLRAPGGLHEWHLVSRSPQFKYWGISAEEIKELRTAISDVKFVNPNGIHGGFGSTKAHNELLSIIDTSNSYNTFVRRLNNWSNYRLEGGVSSLPEGLRLK